MSVQSLDTMAEALADAFRDVIATMCSLDVQGPRPVVDDAALTVSCMLGIAGPSLRGLLRLRCTEAGARRLAAALLGGDETLAADPAVMSDGLGELTNMIGGGVKRRLDAGGASFELSLPSVLVGDARLHYVGSVEAVRLDWSVGGHHVRTSLLYAT